MSLYSSFYSSLSGLATNANALNVIGNNLSNINTVGFKGSNANFGDIFSSALGGTGTAGNGNPIQFGLGVQVNSVTQNFAQASFQSTGSALNMALQGNGFFTLKTVKGQQVFSRAGNFSQNNAGYLVAPDGSNVMGWNRDMTVGSPTYGLVNTSAALAPIRIDAGATASAAQTGNIRLGINLDSAAPVGSTLTSPVQVYDSQGNSQNVLITYTKTGSNTWGWAAAVGAPATVTSGGTGVLTFSPAGNLTSPLVNPSIGFNWNNGTQPQTISWNVVNPDGSNNLTQFAAQSSTNSSYQDGYGSGTLQSLSVDQSGIISGTFTNGQVIPLAQVGISTFNNNNGLVQAGNNTWGQSLASGTPTIGLANQGGRGGILGSNLELSNVDMATEFTSLMLAQNGYQANSKAITTANTLLQDTMNMVR